MPDALFAGIEAGGTKMICAIADRHGAIVRQVRIATAAPVATFDAIATFFRQGAIELGPVRAAGVGSFGPLDLDPTSPGYGCLTTTPKPGWSAIDMLTSVRTIVDAPTAIDTDVNCAGIAEGRHGAGRGLDRFCYVTVGTGIGVSIVESGRPAGGAGHPEAGHMRVPRAPGDSGFAGICPYHGDCIEGLASGPAMKARWGRSAEDLGPDHAAWSHEAFYIAALCVNLTYAVRPRRIILGGGVLERSALYDRVRAAFIALMAGYALDRWSGDAARFIVEPALSDPSPGLVGALELARGAC